MILDVEDPSTPKVLSTSEEAGYSSLGMYSRSPTKYKAVSFPSVLSFVR